MHLHLHKSMSHMFINTEYESRYLPRVEVPSLKLIFAFNYPPSALEPVRNTVFLKLIIRYQA